MLGLPQIPLAISSLGRALLKTAGDVWAAARPLLLPLFVVVAVGAVKFDLLVQLLVILVTAVLAWLLVIVPSAKQSKISAKWGRELVESLVKNLASLLAIGLVVWVLGLPIVNSTPYFETVEGFTSGMVTLSIVLWFSAIGLRLLSFAESRLRAFVVLLFGLALLRLSMALGILPGEPGLRDSIPAIVPILVAAAGLLLLVDVILAAFGSRFGGRLRSGVTWLQHEWVSRANTDRAKGLGFTAAVMASGALLVATTYGLIEAAERGKPLNPPEGVSADAPEPGVTRGAGDAQLNRRYAPVLVFTDAERWTPIRVEPYLQRASLFGPEGLIKKGLTLADLDRTCPGESRNCYTLTIECESGDLPCARGWARDRDTDEVYREGAVYVRGPLRKEERPGLFPDRGPFREQLQTLIQYWYFYYYDEWRAPVFAGLLTQKHEGDWEVVTLGLDAANRPLFVADSAHCSGTWRNWEEVEVSTQLRGPRVHPIVAVAEGSHANYPDPDQKRTSDPGHCAGLPEGMAAAISYASNIRDKTEFGWAWYPPRQGWVELRRGGPGPMKFPGTWGADDRTTLTNFNTHEIGRAKPGPRTPSLQSSWTSPVATIFCRKYKRPPSIDRNALHC